MISAKTLGFEIDCADIHKRSFARASSTSKRTIDNRLIRTRTRTCKHRSRRREKSSFLVKVMYVKSHTISLAFFFLQKGKVSDVNMSMAFSLLDYGLFAPRADVPPVGALPRRLRHAYRVKDRKYIEKTSVHGVNLLTALTAVLTNHNVLVRIHRQYVPRLRRPVCGFPGVHYKFSSLIVCAMDLTTGEPPSTSSSITRNPIRDDELLDRAAGRLRQRVASALLSCPCADKRSL